MFYGSSEDLFVFIILTDKNITLCTGIMDMVLIQLIVIKERFKINEHFIVIYFDVILYRPSWTKPIQRLILLLFFFDWIQI